jgi:predicted nucleic acid-binding protein
MIYLDTSCLLKLVRLEPASEEVSAAIAGEEEVVVSTLAELEALVQLKAGHLAGNYSVPQWRKFEAKLAVLKNQEPFAFRTAPAAIWETAFRQHRNSGELHCKTLDRLHLAIMEKLDLRRLMTRDAAQAKAARELGFEVMEPGQKG